MKLSIVLSLQPAQFQAATFKGDLETNLTTVAALGYQGVELAIRDPGMVDVVSLDRMLQKRNLTVPAIGTGQAWGEEKLSFTDPDETIRQEAIQRILSHLPLGAHFGATIILGLMRGTVQPGVSEEQAKDWLIDALEQIGGQAENQGVRLAVEPINHQETSLINQSMQALDLIQRVGLKSIGLLLDTYHMHQEGEDILKSIQACEQHLFHFHVADSNRMHPGGGTLDFKSILGTLSSIGYAGWVSGEFLPKPDATTAARESIALLKQSIR